MYDSGVNLNSDFMYHTKSIEYEKKSIGKGNFALNYKIALEYHFKQNLTWQPTTADEIIFFI